MFAVYCTDEYYCVNVATVCVLAGQTVTRTTSPVAMSRETIARGALTDSEKSVRPDRDGEGTPCTCMVGSNAHAHSVDSSASRTDIPNKPQNFAVAQACASRTAPHTQFQPQNSFGIVCNPCAHIGVLQNGETLCRRERGRPSDREELRIDAELSRVLL